MTKGIKESKVIKIIKQNPGLSATGYARLLNCKWGTLSSRLYKMCKRNVIKKELGEGMISVNLKVWRYYPL